MFSHTDFIIKSYDIRIISLFKGFFVFVSKNDNNSSMQMLTTMNVAIDKFA